VVVCRKELSDHLGSKRFLMLFGLILVLSLSSGYQGAQSMRGDAAGIFINIFSGSNYTLGISFTQFLFLFGPLIGLVLGFDAINRERANGSLSVLLSQPIFRDSIINGKFLAGVGALSLVAVSTIGIMSGVAIPMLGFGPRPDEIVRIFLLTLLTILYLSVWLAIGLFFSTVTKKIANSMLLSLSVWVFSVLVISILAFLIANFIVPTQVSYSGAAGSQFFSDLQTKYEIASSIQRVSPSILYQEAASLIVDVTRSSSSSGILVSYGSGGAEQDLVSIWPHITALSVILIACFVLSYIIFLRKEIRPEN
jgi:ABC-2 type transport system permease protein